LPKRVIAFLERLQRLNAFVVQTADRLGLVERWQGAWWPRMLLFSFLQFRPVQPSKVLSNQRLFSLFLPSAELTHCSA
jgi:hypothetical protein